MSEEDVGGIVDTCKCQRQSVLHRHGDPRCSAAKVGLAKLVQLG